ncbi:hypothetical protein ES703_56049 [subsurface metagenome]
MIQAYLNNEEIRMFPDIAIGITIENFNISDISNRKIDRTNVIRVPKAGNEDIFEFSSLPNAPTDYAYQDYDFDLIIDGIKIYENGRAFIVGEDEQSYTLHITNNKNIIDLLKSISLADLYTGETIYLADNLTWKDIFLEKTSGFKIDYMFREDNPTNDEFTWISAYSPLSIYIDTILAKIAANYSVTFSGALLTDADFIQMRIPMVQSNIYRKVDPAVDYFVKDIIIHESYTTWDLIKVILQLFCGVFKINGIDMELQKFNSIDTVAPVDWSGKLVSKSKRFSIPDTGQKNYIKYSVSENVDRLAYAAIINCNNENIDYEKTIGSMIAKVFQLRDVATFYTNVSSKPLFAIELPPKKWVEPNTPSWSSPLEYSGIKDIQIVIDSIEFLGGVGGVLPVVMRHLLYQADMTSWTYLNAEGDILQADTTIVKYYDPTSNYSLIETMLTDPVFYEVELLLNIVDIQAFDHFKAVKIDELEGLFYVNRISDFLATSPGTPTKVELIKIS